MEEVVDRRTAEQSLEGLHTSRMTGQGEILKKFTMHVMLGLGLPEQAMGMVSNRLRFEIPIGSRR